VIGDDSAVRAEGDVITVYYQDATVGTLRRAAGTKSGATHKWDLRTLQQPNRFGGYFPQIIPGEDKVASSAPVFVDPDSVKIGSPEVFAWPPDGLNIRLPDQPLQMERRIIEHRLPAVQAYTYANGLDRIALDALLEKHVRSR